MVGAFYFLCGEFLRRRPTEQDFERFLGRLRKLQIHHERAGTRSAYFQTPLASRTRIQAARRLMADIAQHLGELAAHCLPNRRAGDPSCVICAKALVAKHLVEMPSTRIAAHDAHVTEPTSAACSKPPPA